MKHNEFLGISSEGFHHIAYTEWGEANPDLPAVICVHGFSRNGRDFDALASYLGRQGRHVFCPDVVGRGDSAWFRNSQHYNFTQYISDMNALIARTQSHQIDWIGTSMGGMIGMMLAALPNSPIHRLILNDVGPQIPVHGLKKLALSQHQPEFNTVEEAKEYFKVVHAEFGTLTDKQWQTFTENSIYQKSPNLYHSKLDPAVKNPKSVTQFVSDFFHHPHKSLEGILYDIDLWAIWKQIHCPILAIRGAHSELLTSEIIRRMQREKEQVDVYEKKDAGHAPALLDLVDHQKINTWLKTL
ncbi:MAG: alpha/beta fold hydrolase [Legionellales bacterium]